MKKNNVELEIRVPISELEYHQIKEFCNQNSDFLKESHHSDIYYSSKHKNFLANGEITEALSIRNRDNKVILSYKHYNPATAEKPAYNDEYETIVDDINMLQNIFDALDIEKIITIDKKRETYIYQNQFEIALDKIKDLGNFVEIEAIDIKGDMNELNNKLFLLADQIGIDTSQRLNNGYMWLLLKKFGKI